MHWITFKGIYIWLNVLLFFPALLPAQTIPSYQPDRSLRKEIKKAMLAELLPQTPSAYTGALQMAFIGNLPFNDYEKVVQDHDLIPYFMTTPETFHRVICWEIWNEQEIEDHEIQWFFHQVEQENHEVKWNTWTNEQKQNHADSLILKTMWLAYLFKTAQQKADTEAQQSLRQKAENWLEAAFGISPAQLELSEEGLIPIDGEAEELNDEYTQPSPQKTEPSSHEKVTSDDTQNESSEQGLTDQQIKGIYLVTKTLYGLGGMYLENVSYLLLHDGSVYREPTVSPYTFQVEQSKRTEPEQWGKWKQVDDKIIVTWQDGDTEEWTQWHETAPAQPNETLTGGFKSSDAFGGSSVYNFNTIYLNAQGQFAWKTVKGGDTSWKPIYSIKETAGKYTLNKYAITLQYNNGKTERYTFFFYPKKRDTFVIGVNHFLPLDK